MSARRPVLPRIRNRMAARNQYEDAELRAAEAVIRAARREHAQAPRDHYEPIRARPVCRALARLDKVTGRTK